MEDIVIRVDGKFSAVPTPVTTEGTFIDVLESPQSLLTPEIFHSLDPTRMMKHFDINQML